jgi:hypothetical protein
VNWRDLFHVHSDPDWQMKGVWRCYRCRCGAQRVRRAYLNIMGPIPTGWPDPYDRHGQPVDDSGWVKP